MSLGSLSSGERTFILGVGAQKAGTTWLHSYLASAPYVAAGKQKEYHIWDVLYYPALRRFLEPGALVDEAHQLRALTQQDNRAYFAFFDKLMQHRDKSISLDITPSYAGLGPDILSMIQGGFAVRNIRTKAVFLMRDPVERCWSAARMLSRAKSGHTGIAPEVVAAHAASGGAEMRTRYDITLAALSAAFRPEDYYVGIYEDMFEPVRLREVSSFCGVPFRPELTEKTVHTTKKETELGEETYAAIARRYRIVYETVAAAYPRVKQLWPGFAYL
jgi:hypothetical protein